MEAITNWNTVLLGAWILVINLYLFSLYLDTDWAVSLNKISSNPVCLVPVDFAHIIQGHCTSVATYVWIFPVEIQYFYEVRYDLHWAHAP